jgi:hypothetical protein
VRSICASDNSNRRVSFSVIPISCACIFQNVQFEAR